MILIVDDVQENLYSLKTLLQLHDYETDTAISGEEALKKVLKNNYSLIILDVQMPGMDGYEVAEAMTGYSKTKDIPIIFLSAVNIDKRFITKGYTSGGVDYVTKPFDADVLMLKVKTFSRLHTQKRELAELSEQLKAEIAVRKLAQDAVEQMNISLENKVAERTSALEKSNKDLEMSNADLVQYASLASHDLQEPLRKIIYYCNAIFETWLPEDENAQRYFKKVIDSAERMRTLINDLLNYSRISKQADFYNRPLKEAVHEAITDLELLIKEKNAKIVVEDLPDIEVIPGQMRQLFQNLFINAIKFAKKDVDPLIKVSFERKHGENRVTILVADNGIGFESEYKEKIFGIFQRLHERKTYEGTGIGLAIVKKIIDKHNGSISAEGVPEEGAIFSIVLPVSQHK